MLSTNALELFQDVNRMKTISLGCPILNEITGGVSTFGITEITGEAGAGKTQFCLVLALQCVLQGIANGTNDNTAYISCGEGSFPLKRFVQLCDHYSFQSSSTKLNDTNGKESITRNNLLELVHIEMCRTMEDAFEAIDKVIPAMCQKDDHSKIRLVIIDSLAGIVRTDYDTKTSQDMLKRTAMLFRFASKLKWLADTYRLCVVVVNQVSASGFDSDSNNNSNNNGFNTNTNSEPVPALGVAWTHCLNTRWQLFRDTTSLLSCSSSFNSYTASLSSSSSSAAASLVMDQQHHFDALTFIQQQQASHNQNNFGHSSHHSDTVLCNDENIRPSYTTNNSNNNSNSSSNNSRRRNSYNGTTTTTNTNTNTVNDNYSSNNIPIFNQQQQQQQHQHQENEDSNKSMTYPTTTNITTSSVGGSGSSGRSRRYLRIMLSPSHAEAECEYIITTHGVFGLSPNLALAYQS